MKYIVKKRPKMVDGFYIEEIDGEVLLYSPTTNCSIYLNSSASAVWHLCTGAYSGQEIIDILEETYSDQPNSIADDVIATLKLFLKSQAIKLS